MSPIRNSPSPVLELRGITKAFPGVLANDHIDLTLEENEIHALLGENGAGKTTLMNVLYGLYAPDEGEITVRGQRVEIHEPNDAIAQGIGMVHQHFMLVPVLTVTENVMLGVESIKSGVFLDRATAAQRIREISEQYGLEVDPDAYVKTLPVGVQQRVEIIKLLYREADILILDEPTAVLTPQEVEELFKVVRSLVAQGKSVVFITHKLKEVMAIADRITVLRNGRVVGTTTSAQTDEQELAAMMVGRQVLLQVEKGPARPGETVLEVEDLEVLDDRGNLAVRGVSFQVRAGEVLGVAGVQGNGQTELVQALTGLRSVVAGRGRILGNGILGPARRDLSLSRWLMGARVVELVVAALAWFLSLLMLVISFWHFTTRSPLASPTVLSLLMLITSYWPQALAVALVVAGLVRWLLQVTLLILSGMYVLAWLIPIVVSLVKNPREFVRSLFAPKLALPRKVLNQGVAHVPEDRQQDGLVLSFPVSDNLVLNTYYLPPFARHGTLNQEAILATAEKGTRMFDVRTPSVLTPVSSLSGGNQQKVIVAREFSRPIQLLIASQPTRGLDVGSIEYIHRRIVEKRDEGCAVLLVSPELDEVMGLSDRIAVMYEGKIVDVLPADQVTREEIGLLMAGMQLSVGRLSMAARKGTAGASVA